MLVLDASAAAAAPAVHAEIQRASRLHDRPTQELGSGSTEFGFGNPQPTSLVRPPFGEYSSKSGQSIWTITSSSRLLPSPRRNCSTEQPCEVPPWSGFLEALSRASASGRRPRPRQSPFQRAPSSPPA